jgi:DNA repair protein RecO (recombination protein O)
MHRFSERALVVSSVDYGEADRIVTLLTQGHGKVSAFAGGARRSKRRFAGALEPFTLIRVELAERRGSTVRLDSADIEKSYPGVREDLQRIARAMYCLELCRELIREREPHPELFALLEDYLDLLDRRQAGPTSLIAFELNALARAGLMPRFDRCALCEGALGEAPIFDPDHGGGVCSRPACRSRAQFGVPAAPSLLAALRSLQGGAREPLGSEQRRRARELLNLFIAHHLGRKLNSVDFMTQVGLD